MKAPNGANYYLIMHAKAVPNTDTGIQKVTVRMMLGCTESSSFYNYRTQYVISIGDEMSDVGYNKPNEEWDTTPITINGIIYKKWIIFDTYTLDIDCSDGKDQEIQLFSRFAFTDINTESYTPAAGTERAVTATVLLEGVAQNVVFDSISAATKYLDSTITCKFTSNNASYYVRRDVYLSINGTLVSLRMSDLGKKAVGSQTSAINLSDAELSSIYKLVKTTTKATLRVTFRTYSDSSYKTKVGDTAYKDITLTIPEEVKPMIVFDAEPVTSFSWIKSQGIYVTGGVTQAKLTAQAAPGEGSSMVSSSIIAPDGKSYDSGTLSVVLNDAGDYTFTAEAVDARGRSQTEEILITVLPYDAPAITMLRPERGTYNSGWKASDNGPDVCIKFKTTLRLADNGNNYSAAFSLDGAAVTPTAGSTTGLKSGVEQIVYIKNVDSETSHRLSMTATDRLGSATTTTITVQTSNVTIEFNESGKGVAFGKTSEKEALECAWPAYLYDDLFIATKITGTTPFSLRNFYINCYWADNVVHDMIVRNNDGLTLGLGWSGNGDDGESYDTVLDVRPKQANFRGTVTAPRGRFTATNDSSGTERKDVALRLGDADGQHMDMDTNEIQAKEGPTTPGPLYLNLDGGDVYAGDFKIPQIQRGSVTITPTAANTPTSFALTFPKEFSGTPTVIVTAATSVPGTTVLGVGVNSVGKNGCNIWVTRANTTDTVVNWIAVY